MQQCNMYHMICRYRGQESTATKSFSSNSLAAVYLMTSRAVRKSLKIKIIAQLLRVLAMCASSTCPGVAPTFGTTCDRSSSRPYVVLHL
jgi:hypothetical protein